MTSVQPTRTVVLSDEGRGLDITARLAPRTGPATWYPSLAELVRRQPLSSVSVLVLDFRPRPRGVQLVTLGRMNTEFPAMQKVAVLHEEAPLPVVEYLTSCGVDIVWNGNESGLERLASTVDRLQERIPWIAS